MRKAGGATAERRGGGRLVGQAGGNGDSGDKAPSCRNWSHTDVAASAETEQG